MFLTDQEIAERFRNSRSGLELLAVENAAIPVSVLYILVLAQRDKGLGLVPEFVLRGVATGLNTSLEIANLLGVDRALVDGAVAEQVAAGNLAYEPAAQTFSLTRRGLTSASELTALVPVEEEVPITFDRSNWRVAEYNSADLIERRLAESEDRLLIPALKSTRVVASDVKTSDIESHLLQGRTAKGQLQILEILRVRPSRHRYLPIKLLIFGESTGRQLDIVPVVDGEVSPLHERHIAALGGAAGLNLHGAPAARTTPLVISTNGTSAEEPAVETSHQPSAIVSSPSIESLEVTQIGVFDHALHLERALGSASRRLLIISPWIRRSVVNKAFVDSLEKRLRAGVQVHLGYGIGKDDDESHAEALERLHSLARKYSASFTFARLPNSHAKILIYDDCYITTSFNWLSFKGDRNRTYRMEEGTMVSSRSKTDGVHATYSALLEEHKLRGAPARAREHPRRDRAGGRPPTIADVAVVRRQQNK